jgi:hypothetical protein
VSAKEGIGMGMREGKLSADDADVRRFFRQEDRKDRIVFDF